MSDINIKEVVKEKYGNAALRVGAGGSSCCGAVVRSDYFGFVRRRASGPGSGRSDARFPWMRKSDGAGEAECW